jgi:glycosyltransferase involved in cell wall biosynthesis
MRLALVISSLRPGGAEGVLARIAGGLAGRGHEVALLTLDAEPPRPGLLSPLVRHVPLGLSGASSGPSYGKVRALLANLRRMYALRRALLEIGPDAVLSFMAETNVLALLAVGAKLPVIAAERAHPARHALAAPWGRLREYSYPLAAAIAVQTADVAAFFAPSLRPRCVVIPNPALRPEAQELEPDIARIVDPWRKQGGRVLLGLGRLNAQKGFDLLLRAWARLAQDFPDWRPVVLGEGPERPRLLALASELGLAGASIFPGRTAAPGAALARADLFVLPSRYEGFPNALLEALACGVPAVAFDCPSGPAEIIRPGVDGFLAPEGDVDALAGHLARLMGDDALRLGMAQRAPEALERFGLEPVLDLWETLLARVAKTGAGD